VTARLTYFEIVASIYHPAAIRAGKQAGRWVDRPEGRGQSRQDGGQEDTQALTRVVRQAGMSECGKAGRIAGGIGSPTERDKEIQEDRCTNVHTDRQKYISTDIHK